MPAARTLKLRGDQERRRFFVGLSVDASCATASAVLVAASGRGMEARFEVASHVVEEIPAVITAAFDRISGTDKARPADTCLLAMQLAEIEAAVVEKLAAIENQVWGRTLLIGVTDPGVWPGDDATPPFYLSLCDPARLAELTTLNVVEGYPARDVALGGRGYPLDALPLWLLLHNAQKDRLLVWQDEPSHGVFLPASRDESGANRVEVIEFEDNVELLRWAQQRSTAGNLHELVLMDGEASAELAASCESTLPRLECITADSIGIEATALPSACAAILAMLHIDQIPANLPMLTGAAAPRVLGRLTPGSASAWHRLLRDLAFTRALITPLRAAV